MIIIWCHVWYGFVNNGSSYKMSIGLCILLIWITVCYSLGGGFRQEIISSVLIIFIFYNYLIEIYASYIK